jgi:pyruvate-formate lyase-activating enzyme
VVLCSYCLNPESSQRCVKTDCQSVLVWSLPGAREQIFVYAFNAAVVLSWGALCEESAVLSVVRTHSLCRLYTRTDLVEFK